MSEDTPVASPAEETIPTPPQESPQPPAPVEELFEFHVVMVAVENGYKVLLKKVSKFGQKFFEFVGHDREHSMLRALALIKENAQYLPERSEVSQGDGIEV